jgi:hypothetical protein
MHKEKKMRNISNFSLHSIFENDIFDPTVMMVQKLIKKFNKLLGPKGRNLVFIPRAFILLS